MNFKPLLKIGKSLLFSEAVKLGSKAIENKINHAAKVEKFQIKSMAFHGAKKGGPVYVAGILAKIIIVNFPQYGFDPMAITAILSGCIFVAINLLKKKFGLNLKGLI